MYAGHAIIEGSREEIDMKGIVWKDTTSYSQREPLDQRVPRIWKAQVGDIDIIVTRNIYFPDRWFCRSHFLHIDGILRSKDIEQAKIEALKVVKQKLQEYVTQMQSAINYIDIELKEAGSVE